MRNSVLKYLLVCSLLLNVSFVGAAAYTYYRHPHYGPFLAGPATFQGHLFDELSLKPDQASLFQEKAMAFHKAVLEKREEVNGLRGSLIALMRADKRDDKAIDEIVDRINEKQKALQKIVVSHMLEFKSMLAPDQQKKFLDLVSKAMGQPGEGECPLQPGG